MKKTGLILEGGGMRGIYTAGVLDVLMEENLYFPYVIGVSAGACHAISYVSKQKHRSKNAVLRFIDDPRYISRKNLILKGSIMDMDFIFNDIPNKYEFFDYDTFFDHDIRCIVVVTDGNTGEAVYLDAKAKRDREYLSNIVRASSSIPLLTKPVWIDGIPFLDGGMADSVPLRKSVEDGNTKHIVVLTKPFGYRKSPSKVEWFYRKKYKDNPKLAQVLIHRYTYYNQTMSELDELERLKNILVIRPSQDAHVGRMEKNKKKLTDLYELGCKDAKEKLDEIRNYIKA